LSSALSPRGGTVRRGKGGDLGSVDSDCRAAMRSVLESQIIPRLLQVTRPAPAMPEAAKAIAPSAANIETFSRLCVAGDRAACKALIERLMADGLTADSMLVDLVAPAARLLGQRWEDDTLDFMSVTYGLVLMHEMVHALGYEVHNGPQGSSVMRRVMLASAPGSQHVLGLSIVSEFFRKAGWQVVLEVSPSRGELCRAVGNEWFDLLGISVGLESQLADLPALVGMLRSASRNPQPPVLLGGPVFLVRDDLGSTQFGAQAICRDARESLALAAMLVEQQFREADGH
jgi:MerR family transcriptional regulator, light-induced transcriptional regulator